MPTAELQPIILQFFGQGLITNRQPLAPKLAPIGVNVITLRDALIDGLNVEITDKYTLARRAPFIKYCSQNLQSGETVNQFYSVRNLAGVITPLVDTNLGLYSITPTTLTSILTKTTTAQAFVQQVGNMTYISDGVDLMKWDGTTLSSWGIAASNVTPALGAGNIWRAQTLFTPNDTIVDTNGNVELLTAGGGSYSGTLQPIWPAPLASSIRDGQLTWTNEGSIGTWLPATIYAAPSVILDSNGNLQISTAGGTSKTGAAPVWSTGIGGTTTDNTITWTCYGHGSAIAQSGYRWVYAYRTIYGHLSTASPVSNSSGPVIGPQAVNITAFSITGGVVTFTGTNNFVAGDLFTVKGLTNGTYLNNQIFTVLAAGLTTSIFEAATSYPSTSGTIQDGGYTLNVISVLTGAGSTNALCNAAATITNVAVTSGVVTCQAAQNWAPGIWITLTGLAGATFLNNQQVQISSASATQFTFLFTTQDYSATPDSGTATFNAVEVYRTEDGGGIFYFTGAITNPSLTPYDSGVTTAGAGADDGVPGTNVWANPGNVSNASSYATVAVSNGSGGQAFNVVRTASAIAQFVGSSNTSQGPRGAGAGATSGLGPWLNPGNITAADGIYSTSVENSTDGFSTGTLTSSAHGFSIPSTATIRGIVVEILRASVSGGRTQDASVLIVKGGVAGGTDHSSSSFWPSTAAYASYGSSTDLWGLAWLPADINSSSFGVSLTASSFGNGTDTAEVDFTRITVHYTTVAGAPTSATATLLSVAAGDDILLAVQAVDSISSVGDNKSNTYTLLKTEGNTNVYAAFNVAAGTTKVTANFSGTGGGTLVCAEVHGIQSLVDVSAVNSSTAFGAFNSGAVTTLNATDIILSVVMAQGAAPSGNPTPTLTIPTGYTSIQNVGAIQASNTGYALQMAFEQVSSTGTYNSNWTTANSVDTSNINVYGLTIAIKSVIGGTSDGLNASSFGYAVPLGTSIQGIQVTFDGFYNGAANVSFYSAQLMRNGQPVGNPKNVVVPTSQGASPSFTLGGSTDTWGISWNFFDFNNSRFGVKIIATNGDSVSRTFDTRHVQIEVFGQSDIWTFSDAIPDSQLVSSLIAPLSHLNDPPPGVTGSTVPVGGTILAYWNGRLWMAVGNKVYFSAGPDTLNGIPEECWPPAYFFTFPGNVTGLRVAQGGLLVAVSDTFWAILGGPQTTAFYPDRYLSHVGVLSDNCLAQDGDTLLAYSSSSQFYVIGANNKTPIGFNVGNILLNGQTTSIASAFSFLPSAASITVHRNGYDEGIWISNGSGALLRYGINTNSWSTIYKPVLNNSQVSAGVISSVETSPGVWTLLLSSNQGGDFIYFRNFNATRPQDYGGVFDAVAVVGSITASEPGQLMVPLRFITLMGVNSGNVPTVSFLPNEIYQINSAAFTVLPTVQNDPVFLVPSTSLMGLRWPTSANQSGTPLMIRNVQVKIDFGAFNTLDELFNLGLKFTQDQLS